MLGVSWPQKYYIDGLWLVLKPLQVRLLWLALAQGALKPLLSNAAKHQLSAFVVNSFITTFLMYYVYVGM